MRAPVKWYGGKGNLRGRILPFIPRTQVYVEPYGGGGSILCARKPSPVEVYNDLDGNLVNLFRALQEPDRCAALKHRLEHTLYSRAEFGLALAVLGDENSARDDRAWAFFVAQNQGFSGHAETIGDWGRAFVSVGGMAHNANNWLMRLAHLPDWHQRFARVQIDNRCALEVIRYWDSKDTTFYIDPPYVSGTRLKKAVYDCEVDDDHHAKLVDLLLTVQGAVVCSGYAHPIYRPMELGGWERINIDTVCSAAGRVRGSGLQGEGSAIAKVPRIETVWRNPMAVRLCASKQSQRGLFDEVDEVDEEDVLEDAA